MQSATIKLRRKIRWSTITFFFLSGIVTATWASRIPEIQQKFHLSDAQWGAVLFAMQLGLVSSLPLSSWFIAKFTSAKVMTISGVIYTLLLFTLSMVTQVWALTLLLFLFGFARSFYTMSVNTNAIEVQRLYENSIVASFHGAWSLASFVAAGIGTFMISQNVDPTIHFVVISLLVTILLIFNKRGGNKRDANAERKPFFIRPDKYLLILGLIGFCTMMCEGTVFDWGVNYFEKVVKADKSLVTLGYTAFLATMTLGRLIGDKIIAYLGLRKVLMVNGLCMAAGFLIVVMFPSIWSAGFGFLLIGLGDSIIIPTLYSLAGKSERMKPAYAIASVSMIGYIGFLAAPLIVGSLSEAWGMSSAFALMAVLSFLIFVFSFMLGRTHAGNEG